MRGLRRPVPPLSRTLPAIRLREQQLIDAVRARTGTMTGYELRDAERYHSFIAKIYRDALKARRAGVAERRQKEKPSEIVAGRSNSVRP